MLIKKNMIHILGTDTHRHLDDLNTCYEKLKKLVDEKMYDDLTWRNFDKIVNGEKVSTYEIIKLKELFTKEIIK